MKKILFVCTGNTCRSPMAERIMKYNLQKEEKLQGLQIQSAGISVPFPSPAASHAIEVLKEMDIDLEDHKAQMVTKALLEESDLILAMTQRHKQMLLSVLPNFEDKIFTLKEYIHKDILDLDVADPFGGTKEMYKKSAIEIQWYVKEMIKKLKKNNEF